jgi:phage shock protein E
VAELGLAKGTPIYLYCAVGGRAEKARQSLQALGYTNVTNVGGLDNARQVAGEAAP